MSKPSRIAIVKELGARSPRCLAAHAARPNEEPELVVVERYPAALGEAALTTLEEDTKTLVAFDHPNVATLIASVRLKGDVAVLSEWVDGESVASILAAEHPPSLEILLRIVGDVNEAVSALHARFPGRVCGALAVDDVFVGVDGVTRITRFHLGGLAPDALGERRMASMAPEYVRGERSERCDVYTLGTLLFECFMNAKYAPGARVDASKREPWATGLADVIARAVAPDPAARYATVGDLASAVSRVASSKVAPRAAVSQYVAKTFGERIEARLVKLEPKVDVSLSNLPPPVTEPPPPVVPPPAAAVPHEPPKREETPVVPVAKVEPLKIATPPKVETPKVEAPKVEPVKPAPAAAKVAEKSTPKQPEVAKAVPAARKPVASTPEVVVKEAPAAKKAVPLPKRQPSQPDSAPKVVVAPEIAPAPKKANGAGAPKPAAVAKTKEPASPPPATVQEKAEELEIDVDLASVRPPPLAPSPPAPPVAAPPPPEPAPAPAPKKKSVRPPSQEPEAPKPKPKSVRPPAQAQPNFTDDEIYPKRSPYRGPLLVLGALLLAAASFAAGRLTAPEPWQPPPYVPPAASTTTATATTTTAAVAPPPPPSVTTSAAPSASAPPATEPHAQQHVVAPPASPAPRPSGSYWPSGI